jgi:translation initiation factor eIF-2B subunit gamma
LISPPASAPAIQSALDTNPHLTSLPSPKPDLLAPEGLDQTTGTAEIFRLPQVRAIIKGDFIVLPCDLVCEMGGEALVATWMIKQAGLGGATGGDDEFTGPKMALGGEKGGRRGGLSVWYPTKGELAVKGEETDFIATSPLSAGPVPPPEGSLLPHTSNLVYSLPTDTLNDITEEKKSLPLRHAMMRKHPRLRMLTSHRDAHLYIFPAWILDMINSNERMDNLSEDVIGWWAKAGWQDGLAAKLGMQQIFDGPKSKDKEDSMGSNAFTDESIDIGSLSSTWTSKSLGTDLHSEDFPRSRATSDTPAAERHLETKDNKAEVIVPPILAYVHPGKAGAPLIRRVDTAPLLLLASLHLAKLDSVEEVGREAASPLAHAKKVAHPSGIAGKCTVTRPDCLLAENVTVEERCAIKECVVGANCQIRQGAKLTRCVLMDGVVVGKGCKLTGSILGRRSEIGEDSILQDCEVEDNMRIEPKSKSLPFLSCPNPPILRNRPYSARERPCPSFFPFAPPSFGPVSKSHVQDRKPSH